MGVGDRTVSHRSHKNALSRHGACRGYHETQWRGAAARGYYLWGQPVSGSEYRELHPRRFAGCEIGTVHGANPADKGDERCRPTSRAIRSVCSTKILLLGERTRLLQLRHAARGGFPDCPGGNCWTTSPRIISSSTSLRTLETCWGNTSGRHVQPCMAGVGCGILGPRPETP